MEDSSDFVNLNIRVHRDLRKACHMAALDADQPLVDYVTARLMEDPAVQQKLAELKRKKRKEK